MDRPIKGNASGKYDMTFVDPTNDICAYYGGMSELGQLVRYLETVTYHRVQPAVVTGESKLYGKQTKEQHFQDECSVCLSKFAEGEQVKVLPCRHCFHKECVAPWFSSNNHCPNCRFELPQE